MITQLSDGRSLAALPREWRRDKVSRLCDFVGSGGTPPTGNPDFYDGDIPWVQTGDLNDERLERTAKTITEEGLHHSAARLYPSETLLVAMYGATIGKLGILQFAAAVNQACCALLVRKTMSMRFMFYTLRSMRSELIAEAIGGGQQNIGQETIKQTYVLYPPLPEQRRIAAYLDASCAAIDAAVAAKRRQLETLDGLRKSIIHSFFSSHTDTPHERLKDVAARITSGVTPEGGASGYLDSGIPLLRSQNVHFDGLRLDDVAFISTETHADMSGSQLKARDVLLNITGASIGRCTFVPDGFGEGNVNQHVCIIRSGPRVDHRFVAAFLSSPMGQDQILSTFTGASRQGLSHSDLGLIRIPFPKVSVQRKIVDSIEQHDLKHRRLSMCIESQIATLTAYRTSLIHECVTGQRRIAEADLS